MKDLLGQIFGKWTVLYKDPNKSKNWFCSCACDRAVVRSVREYYLTSGRSKCCGCSGAINRVGQHFGRWKVIERDLTKPSAWICQCSCGTVQSLLSSTLTRGASISCGCAPQAPFMNFMKALMKQYQKGARGRDIEFSLTLEECEALFKSNCTYCNRAPAGRIQGYRHDVFVYTGIDRADSNRGYHTYNVTPCCKTCNMAKSVMAVDEFLEWVKSVYWHSVKPKEIATQLINYDGRQLSFEWGSVEPSVR